MLINEKRLMEIEGLSDAKFETLQQLSGVTETCK